MTQTDVVVKLDDRIRLMSAVLAATQYPEKGQLLAPHGTHAHARATRKYLAEHTSHPVVQSTQSLLDQNTPLEALYALVMLMPWPALTMSVMPPWVPAHYNEHLRDFYETTNLADFWQREKGYWDKTVQEAEHVFQDVKFKEFFKPFLGEINEEFVFMPNISYPADYDLGIHIGRDLICIAPPPRAWGDSPPWPYDESTMVTYSYRAAMMVYGRILLKNYLRAHAEQLKEITQQEMPLSDQFKAKHPTWEDQFSTLFLSATVAMYLEEHVDEREYQAYMIMEKKARGMVNLPGTVSVLRRYLQEVGSTDKYANLIEFLPIFPKQLRVAQRIVTF
ncbi:MAG: hypothetical protein OHK0046_45200 [Anaerolineae bacterium]